MRFLKITRKLRLLPSLILFTAFCLAGTLFARAEAEADYRNPETGYIAVIEDGAQLLSGSEKEALLREMIPVTEFGNSAFCSTSENSGSAEAYAEQRYRDFFGTNSGTLFLIDMDNRRIQIFSDGAVYRIITKNKADTITDNIYRDASKGSYGACAASAFRQIGTLLQGGRISEPMRYIGNGFLALILALLVNFILVNSISRVRRIGNDELVQVAKSEIKLNYAEGAYTGESRRYSPVEHGGGGGGRSGGGGGGGGGHSGGGGGHSF